MDDCKTINTRKINGKKILKGVIFLVIFAGIFFTLQGLFQAKWIWTKKAKESSPSTSTWGEYRSLEKDTIEVLFLGTSHVYHAIDPMFIYENSGITSYAIAGPGMRMDLCYLSLEEALKTQSPKVVFFDMSPVHWTEAHDEAKAHKVLDQLPLSLSKIKYAFTNGSEDMKPLDVLFPLFRYHARWEELTEEDQKFMFDYPIDTYIRGHYIVYGATETKMHFNRTKTEFELTDYNREYLEKIVALCKKNDIELVLCKFPTPNWYITQSEGCAAVAEELGVPYEEFYYAIEDMGIDPKTDFKDETDHLNQIGAEKLDWYLMWYMVTHFDLTDQRTTNTRWNEDAEHYNTIKQQKYEAAKKKAAK